MIQHKPRQGSRTHRLARVGLLLWAGLASAAMAGSLSGTAMIRERIALPPDAVFEATLQDISRADAPALVLGTAKLDPAGQTPFRFEIGYEDSAVQAGGRYTVRAVIKHKDRLLYTSDRIYSVLNGQPSLLNMSLVQVPASRPATEGPSAGPHPDSPLRGSYWRLTELGDGPVQVAAKQREAHLVLATQQPHVKGSASCNRLMASFELDGERLSFGSIGLTRMACPSLMEQEQRFVSALGRVARYRIHGSTLELLDSEARVLARLEATALR